MSIRGNEVIASVDTAGSRSGIPAARTRPGFIAAAVGGILELTGLIWDAIQHRLDPGLAAREDLFSLGNLSHDLLIGGIALAVIGVAYELLFGAPFGGIGRRGRTALGTLLVALLAANAGVAVVSAGLSPADDHHDARVIQTDDATAQALLATLQRRDLRTALDELVVLADHDPEIARRAHDLAHVLGQEAIDKYGTPSEAMKQCRDAFLYGCYHGALKAYFTNKGTTRPSDVVGVCPAELGRLLHFQCLHGLGHGVLGNLGHDLFRALTYCDALANDFEHRSCYGGVFMENIVVAIDQVAGRAEDHRAEARPYLRPDDPLYPCNVVAERYRTSCYQLQTSGMLLYNGRDFAKTAVACDSAPRSYVTICFESLGRDVSGDKLRDDAATISTCESMPSPNRAHCFAGAAKNLLDAPQRLLPFCAAVPGSGKAICYNAAGQQFAYIYADPEQRTRACAQGEPAYVKDCEAGTTQ